MFKNLINQKQLIKVMNFGANKMKLCVGAEMLSRHPCRLLTFEQENAGSNAEIIQIYLKG